MKKRIITKADEIGEAMGKLHAHLQEQGDERGEKLAQILHGRLNQAAELCAEFFDEDVSTFSGGTGKPG